MRESVFWNSSFETLAEVFFTDITGAIRTLMGGGMVLVFNNNQLKTKKACDLATRPAERWTLGNGHCDISIVTFSHCRLINM